MTKITSTKPFLRALAGETLSPPPVWLMRQAGRYLSEYLELRQTATNFLEFCYTPDKAVEVTLQPLRRYHFDAAILFSDILVIPDALGQSVAFKTGEGPLLDPVRTVADLERLSADRLHDHLAPVYETVRRLSRDIPPTIALIGFCGAPWTVATYMVEGRGGTDYGVTKDWAYRAPAEFSRLMDLLVTTTADYLIAQVTAGAECLQIFDSWAGVLSESQFHKWVIEPTIRIVERVRAVHPDVPIIGFPKGAGALYVDYIRETKINGVGLDTTVPLTWAAENLQPHCTVQGNLENHLLVTGGEALETETKRIMDVLGHGPFIFNLGHGILPLTPPENVAWLLDVVRGKN